MRILVAGIGNIFLGDDSFGPAVIERLLERFRGTAVAPGAGIEVLSSHAGLPTSDAASTGDKSLPANYTLPASTSLPTSGGANAPTWPVGVSVDVVDLGIRGMDLAYALTSGIDAAVLIDAMARGGEPGTLYLIEPTGGGVPEIQTHAMDPARVLAFAATIGTVPEVVRVIGCEPARLDDDEDIAVGLSDQVTAAIDLAVTMTIDLVDSLAALLANRSTAAATSATPAAATSADSTPTASTSAASTSAASTAPASAVPPVSHLSEASCTS